MNDYYKKIEKDILKYCLYYKGEKKCLQNEKSSCARIRSIIYTGDSGVFETEYYFGAFQDKSRKMWERLGSNMS